MQRRARILLVFSAISLLPACVTVKPQQRSVLSDPVMRFGGDEHDQRERAKLRHALDNREGSFGGEGVAGGGCGCN